MNFRKLLDGSQPYSVTCYIEIGSMNGNNPVYIRAVCYDLTESTRKTTRFEEVYSVCDVSNLPTFKKSRKDCPKILFMFEIIIIEYSMRFKWDASSGRRTASKTS